MRIKSQNLIEFAVVMPFLILIILGVVELSLFWRTTQTVQRIALDAAVVAAREYVYANSTDNPAINEAKSSVLRHLGSLGLTNITFNNPTLNETLYGESPFTYYEYNSNQTVTVEGVQLPVIKLTVDYRDPYQKGIVSQLTYQYKTVFLGMEIRLPNGKYVKILPRDIPISSTKIQQYVNY